MCCVVLVRVQQNQPVLFCVANFQIYICLPNFRDFYIRLIQLTIGTHFQYVHMLYV